MKHTFFKSLMMPALAAILLATGCTKKIDDAFANPNALTKQPVEELLPGVISNMAIQHSANGTLYGPQNDGLYFGRYVQFWATNGTGNQYDQMGDNFINRSDILGPSYQERYNALYRGGITVTTTLDAAAQAKAEKAAKDKLPANRTGIQSSLVSLETSTGALRALVGGPGFVPGRTEVNLALRRRQTGSSIKMFVLTAALEAGVQASDLIDGTLPCTLPNPGLPEEPFKITKGVSHPVSPLAEQTWLSINCAYARLAQVVGLDKVVALMYGMMSSDFMPKPEWGTDAERLNLIKPYASLSTGANELSPLDMASGAQTIANLGVHHEPYFVEKIEDATGVIYQHELNPDQALSEASALRSVDALKGVLKFGTARRTQLDGGRPAAGKTGTQDDNTNAWFVGFTRELTTAVWVGDPRAYTPMVNIPEFVKADGYTRIQGAMYPARIWKQLMDEALGNTPVNELFWGMDENFIRKIFRIIVVHN